MGIEGLLKIIMWPFRYRGKDRIFCECFDDKHEWCVDPEMVILALEDAGKEMSYSNWANDKFDRAEKVIRKYCKEHKIPMKFTRVTKEESLCNIT